MTPHSSQLIMLFKFTVEKLDHHFGEFEARYGQYVCVHRQDTYSKFARAHLEPVGCGEHYNLSANRVALGQLQIVLCEAKMIVTLS